MKAIETTYNGYRFRSRLEARWAVFWDALGIPYEYEPQGFNLAGGIRYLPDFYLPTLKWWVEIKGTDLTDDDRVKCERFSHVIAENLRFVQLSRMTRAVEAVLAKIELLRPTFLEGDLPTGLRHLLNRGSRWLEDDRQRIDAWKKEVDGFDFTVMMGDPMDCRISSQVRWADFRTWSHCPGADESVHTLVICPACDRLIHTEVHRWPHGNYHFACPWSNEPDERHDAMRANGLWLSTDRPPHEDPRLLAAYAAARSARFEHGETPRLPALAR